MDPVAVAASAQPGNSSDAERRPAHPRLLEFLEKATRSRRLPAVAAGVWQDGVGLMLAARGLRSRAAHVPVTDDDCWHIGSITKSMTTLLLARLLPREGLTLDAPLSVLSGLPLHETLKSVSLRFLLAHRAGLDANPPSVLVFPKSGPVTHGAPQGHARDAMIAPYLLKPVKPGKPRYSNIGFMLAGHIAERLGGDSFEQLLLREVAGPLGLASLGFGPPRGAGALDQPLGHRSLMGFMPRPLAADSIEADLAACLSPAGLVHMSMADLLTYGRAVLRLLQGEDGLVPTVQFRDVISAPWNDYAGGWVLRDEPWSNGPYLAHNGSNQRWYADLTILPGMGRVVAFATNVFGFPGFGAAMRWRGIAAVRGELMQKGAAETATSRS